MSARIWKSMILLCALLAPLFLSTPDGFAQGETIRYVRLPKELIESRLRRFSRKNEERESTLRQMFMEAGCDGDRLTEQPMKDRKQANVICTREGSTHSVLIIGAHFDHADEYGLGVVDNWSGASLLPSLFESMKDYLPKHTLRFIGFAEEEKGLVGSDYYVKQLNPAELNDVRLMIDLDSLGLGPTRIWQTHSDPRMVANLEAIAERMHLPLGVMDADRVGDEDSTSFRKLRVPTLMLHSITQQTLEILHSPRDNLSQIKLADYYDSYRLIDVYLSYVDGLLD
jgi:hypothetical protein